MDAVGVKVFGKQWTATDIKAVIRDSNPYFVNNSDDGVMRKKLVQLIIIEALDSRKIEAEISIPDSRQLVYNLWVRDSASSKGSASTPLPIVSAIVSPAAPLDANSDEEDEDEAKFDFPFEQYKKFFGSNIRPSIRHASWANKLKTDKIDWFRSEVELEPLDFMCVTVQMRNAPRAIHFSNNIIGDDINIRNLWIKNAVRAVEQFAEMPAQIMPVGWGPAYVAKTKEVWPEIIAAIWRIIAINGYTIDVKQSTIREALIDYLTAQGFDEEKESLKKIPSTASLNEVLKEIFNQWRLRLLSASVKINTGDPVQMSLIKPKLK